MDDIKFERKLLRDWLRLEELRGHILEAAEKRNFAEVSAGLIAYISAASNLEYRPRAWFDDLEAFENAVRINLPTLSFALLKTKIKDEKFPWEYEGRTWYYWLHVFSSAYGWTEDVVAHLDIDTAIGLLQEILIEEQLNHEWEYSLTEMAYPYDEKSKKSHFRELPRPDWMKKITPPPKKVMIRKDMLPVGNVINEVQTP